MENACQLPSSTKPVWQSTAPLTPCKHTLDSVRQLSKLPWPTTQHHSGRFLRGSRHNSANTYELWKTITQKHTIICSILEGSSTYNRTSRICQLCLREKYYFTFEPQHAEGADLNMQTCKNPPYHLTDTPLYLPTPLAHIVYHFNLKTFLSC